MRQRPCRERNFGRFYHTSEFLVIDHPRHTYDHVNSEFHFLISHAVQILPEILKIEKHFWAPYGRCLSEWRARMSAHNRTLHRGMWMGLHDAGRLLGTRELLFTSLDHYMLQVCCNLVLLLPAYYCLSIVKLSESSIILQRCSIELSFGWLFEQICRDADAHCKSCSSGKRVSVGNFSNTKYYMHNRRVYATRQMHSRELGEALDALAAFGARVAPE